MTNLDRRTRDYRRREADILATALRLFNGDAWQQVTIEQIAQAVNIGKGTIYKHFTSKDELYARLALDFHAAALAALGGADAELPVLDRFREALRSYWRMHAGPSDVQRVVEYCERLDVRHALRPETRARLEAVDAAFGEVLFGLLREAVAVGVLPNKPLHTLLFGVQATLFGAVRHAHRCRAQSMDEQWAAAAEAGAFRDETIDFIMAALAGPMRLAA